MATIRRAMARFMTAVTAGPTAAAAAVALVAFLAAATGAAAAEIKVLTAGAFKPVVAALVPGFEHDGGHRVVVANDTAGALARRIAAGEAFDVVVLTAGAVDELARGGKVVPGSRTPLARVAIGVAVKRGALQPDISSVAAFRQALLDARAVAYIDPASGGSSGVYLARLFEQWGIAPQIARKAVLVPGGLVAERVVSGEADLALHQISEILAVPGTVLVGPLPPEIQNYTVYAGAVSAAAGDPAAARAFLDRLAGDEARGLLAGKGMQAP